MTRPQRALDSDGSARPIDDIAVGLGERAGWMLVWFGVLTGGVSIWHLWWYGAPVVVLAPIVILGALAGMVTCWVVASQRSSSFQYVTLVFTAVSVVVPQVIVIATRRFYLTDSAAFDHIATRALLSGHNPYTTSMAGAERLVPVADRFWTYMINGGHVARASYPAGSFLINVPAMALGLVHNAVDYIDLAAWLVTALLVFVLLPPSLRWVGALLLLTPTLVTMGTDATFLPLLVLAVWRWDRFGQEGAGLPGWVGPLALGLACGTKQTPWFFLPFLLIGVGLETHRRARPVLPVLARYLSLVIAGFAVLNVPFAVWDPGAWARGMLTPLVLPLVADGQGLVTLATHGLTGGVNLSVLSLAGALALVTLLVAFVLWYPWLKRAWPLLVPVAFFFPSRSLSSYLFDLVAVALVAATSVAVAPGPRVAPRLALRARRLPRALVAGVPAVGTVLASALAFTGAPLSLEARAVTTSNAGRVVDTVTVWVRNDTGGTLTPHFMVNMGNNPDGFLTPLNGDVVTLGPHQEETVTLRTPDRTVAPQSGARWLVEAYTVSPRALSTSSLQSWKAPETDPSS